MIPDDQLLRRYAQNGDEAAFAELVRRYVDMVYSAALRLTFGDAPLAQDISQSVFTDMARKAWKLSGRATASGWLHTSVRYAAAKARRGEMRRRVREQEAFAMQEPTTKPEFDWSQLQPLLDEAVGQLREGDRDLVTLRFFQGKSHGEIGVSLGLSEDTARKRVDRALEKLREHFTRRGITVSAGVLAATMAANAVQAAPAGFWENLTDVSMAEASGAASGSLFIKILLMNIKTKLLLAVALIMAIMAIFTINWQQQLQKPISVNATPSATSPRMVASARSPVVVAPNSQGAVAPSIVKATDTATSNGKDTAVSPSGPIRIASEPIGGASAVMAALEAYKEDPNAYIAASGSFVGSDLRLDDLSLLKIEPLVAFYQLSVTRIATGGGLEAAVENGFIYAVYPTTGKTAGTGSALVNAVVRVDAANAAIGVTLDRLLYESEIADALKQLAEFDQVRKGSYEVRRLTVVSGANNAAMVKAFWLKSDSGGADLIFPFQIINPALRQTMPVKQLYASDEFLKLVQPIAQRQTASRPPVIGP